MTKVGATLSGLLVTSLTLVLIATTDTRSFGVYQSGGCAYEVVDTGSGKVSCPDKMPDKYYSHIVSDEWSH